ncbi:MAG: tetratricopeptide repeat protein [Nitrolancea sp.]
MATVRSMLPKGPATDPGKTVFLEGQVFQRLAVELSLSANDFASAHAWLEAHDRWLDWSGAVLGRAEGAVLWAQYHHVNGDPDQSRSLAEQALSHATDPRQPLALIAIHRFLGQLDTEDKQFEAAKEHLQESLTLAEACQAPFERALTLLEFARLRLAQGTPNDMRALLSEVRSICEPLGAKPTVDKAAALERSLSV